MNKGKKILIVANVAKEHVLKFHLPFIKFLKEKGWTVHVACSGEDDIPYVDAQFRMPYKRNPFTFGTFKGIKELKKIIQKENYDIVHCHTPTGGLVARLSSKKFRKKGLRVIYTSHGFHFFKGANILNWVIYFPVEWLLSIITDDIITINQEDYISLTKYSFKSKGKYFIKGVGVDTKSFINDSNNNIREELNISSQYKVLVYVAEIIKNKNQYLLVDALSELVKENDKFKLLLVGPDYSKGKIEKYINSKKLSEHVYLLGWRNDIASILNCCDVYVASSIREGFGINIIEAMLMKTPIVATYNRGHSTIINNMENGILTDFSTKNMARAIQLILSDFSVKDQIIKKAHEDAALYDLIHINEQLYRIYLDRSM